MGAWVDYNSSLVFFTPQLKQDLDFQDKFDC